MVVYVRDRNSYDVLLSNLVELYLRELQVHYLLDEHLAFSRRLPLDIFDIQWFE